MANHYDCEPFLIALEEQADNIGAATTDVLQCCNTFKDSTESVLRSVDNLKKNDSYDKEGYEVGSWRQGCRKS